LKTTDQDHKMLDGLRGLKRKKKDW